MIKLADISCFENIGCDNPSSVFFDVFNKSPLDKLADESVMLTKALRRGGSAEARIGKALPHLRALEAGLQRYGVVPQSPQISMPQGSADSDMVSDAEDAGEVSEEDIPSELVPLLKAVGKEGSKKLLRGIAKGSAYGAKGTAKFMRDTALPFMGKMGAKGAKFMFDKGLPFAGKAGLAGLAGLAGTAKLLAKALPFAWRAGKATYDCGSEVAERLRDDPKRYFRDLADSAVMFGSDMAVDAGKALGKAGMKAVPAMYRGGRDLAKWSAPKIASAASKLYDLSKRGGKSAYDYLEPRVSDLASKAKDKGEEALIKALQASLRKMR